MLNMHEITTMHVNFIQDQMADLFINILDGSARLFLIHNAEPGISYATLRENTLT